MSLELRRGDHTSSGEMLKLSGIVGGVDRNDQLAFGDD